MDNYNSTSKYRSCYATVDKYVCGNTVPIVNPQPATLNPSIFCNFKPHTLLQPTINQDSKKCFPYSNLKTYWS